MDYSLFSEAAIVLDDGTELSRWKSYSINTNFLTPTDGWSFTFGTPDAWKKVKDKLIPGKRAQILIDGVVQLTGYIDSVRATRSASSGVSVSVQGRDILAPMCKSNIHPATKVKGRTVGQILESVFAQVYPGGPPELYYDNELNLDTITDSAVAKRKVKLKRSGSVQAKSVVEYYQAHPQEGAFEFCARLLRRNGLWMWAAGDGSVVVSAPDYKQAARYVISCRDGGNVIQSSDATWTWDKTNVPSEVIVRGRSASKEWDTKSVTGSARCDGSVLHCPSYIQHDEATTMDEAAAFALQELSRLRQEELVYECTCPGHRDPLTGLFWAVDTVATIEDDFIGESNDWWVLERTFSKGATEGTKTTLKFVPLGAIQFSDEDAP